MREATGGAFFLKALIFVILIFFGVIFFAVLYNKAFRMKSEIVSIFEKFEGNEELIRTSVENTIDRYNYDPKIDKCPTTNQDDLVNEFVASQGVIRISDTFCAELICRDDMSSGYYKIITFVNIHSIPIFRTIFRDKDLSVVGNTKAIYSKNVYDKCRNAK